jgi:hypothetical protein
MRTILILVVYNEALGSLTTKEQLELWLKTVATKLTGKSSFIYRASYRSYERFGIEPLRDWQLANPLTGDNSRRYWEHQPTLEHNGHFIEKLENDLKDVDSWKSRTVEDQTTCKAYIIMVFGPIKRCTREDGLTLPKQLMDDAIEKFRGAKQITALEAFPSNTTQAKSI